MKRSWFVRFRLSSLLLFLTLAAGTFGYLRYRREVVRRECEQLDAAGVDVSFVDVGPQWLKRVIDEDYWLRRPATAQVTIVQVAVDRFNVAGRNLEPTAAEAALLEIKARLSRVGVDDVSLEIMPAPFFWHDPEGTDEKDAGRRMAGNAASHDMQAFAVEHGFTGNGQMAATGGPSRALGNAPIQLPAPVAR